VSNKMKKKSKGKSEEGEYVLVYSTDAPSEKNCLNCRRPLSACVCKTNELASVGKLRPAYRIEKKGRGGKTVSVISKLPAHETFLKKLLSHLKSSLGTGGTFYISEGEGVIEIQGEQKEKILDLISRYK